MNSLPPILRAAVADVVKSLGDFAADPLFAEKFSLIFDTNVPPPLSALRR
ncbi:MAG: hypothetical protein ACK5CA_03095 [Cyanobacteriota bacterium]|jgi:hypothetical protein